MAVTNPPLASTPEVSSSAAAGYIIIGLLAFVLGVCVTVLCFGLKAFQKKDEETGDGDGRVH